jgi:gluconolactonase
MRGDANWQHAMFSSQTRRRLSALFLLASLFSCSSDGSPNTPTQAENTEASGQSETSGGAGSQPMSNENVPIAGDMLAPSGHTGGNKAGSGMNVTKPEMGGQGGMSMAPPAAGSSGMAAVQPTAGMSGSGGMGTPPDSMMMSYPPLEAAAIGMPKQIAMGFALAESPLWDPCTKQLIFADVSAAGGGAIKTIDDAGKVSAIMTGTGNTNGMAWDIDGGLVLTQMKGHVVRRSRSGMITQIDPPGSMFATPDDVVVRSDGTIYFSDGDFCPVGALLGYGTSRPVYTVKPNTTTLINSGMVRGPNGIELTPDEKTLYVNGYGEGTIWKFDVMPDGSIMKQTMPFATGLTDPDSMCLDAAGNIYVAVSTGIQVFRPDGTKVTLIRMSAAAGSCTKAGMTNCTFGGEDGKTMFITAWTALFKIENMPIPGLDWIVGNKRAKCM